MIAPRLSLPLVAALVPAAFLACSSPPPSTPPAPTVTPAATAAAATTAPAPTQAPSATAQSAPEPESPFHVIAEVPSEITLHVVGKTVYATGTSTIGEVAGDGIHPIGKGREELPEWGFPAFVGGSGDKAFLSFTTDNGRVGYSVLYARNGDGWKAEKTLQLGTMYSALGPWKGGSVLAATMGAGIQLTFQKPGFAVVSGAKGGEPRVPKGAKKPCPAAMFPTAVLSFESGDVLAIGPDCQVQDDYGYPGDKALLARWAPGKPDPVITELASKASTNTIGDAFGVVAGRAPNDVWLSSGGAFGQPFFLHFDGTSTTKVEGAPGADPTSLAVAADGTLYAIFDGALHRRSADGKWEELRLPASQKATSIAVSGTDVWVAATNGPVSSAGERPTALLHLGPPPAAVQKVAPPAKPAPLYKQLKPVTPGCKSLFVMLYAFTKVTPPDYDFPLTRKALKGKQKYAKARFVVTEDGGRKFFGAFVPDIATGHDLTALIEKEVSGAKPAFVCSDPTVVSDFKLDLATGERVK